jgi:hypothetical protein
LTEQQVTLEIKRPHSDNDINIYSNNVELERETTLPNSQEYEFLRYEIHGSREGVSPIS